MKNFFFTINVIGLFSGLIVTTNLIRITHAFWIPYFVMISTVILSFLIFSFATKIITGKENYVLYRQLLFSICCVTFSLIALNAPLFTYLDIYLVGFGIFHAIGRIACFKAGCCHGRPANFGNRYSKSQLKSGFPAYLVNVKLFPVQLLEALGIFTITVYCLVILFAANYQPGQIVVAYLLLYAMLRFILEFMRGDTDRPYFSIYSEAQWTSLVVVFFIVLLSISELLPNNTILLISGIVLLVAALAIYFIKQVHPLLLLTNASHIKEIANIIVRQTTASNSYIKTETTSLGLKISISQLQQKKFICTLSSNIKFKPDSFIQIGFRQIKNLRFSNKRIHQKKVGNSVTHFVIE